jgi:S-adenosylmethionine hydrolase
MVAVGELLAHILYVDTFGNVKLTALGPDLPAALGPVAPGTELALDIDGRPVILHWQTTFGDAVPGEPLLYEDSYGRLCLALNQGDAAASLGLVEDQAVAIRRAT